VSRTENRLSEERMLERLRAGETGFGHRPLPDYAAAVIAKVEALMGPKKEPPMPLSRRYTYTCNMEWEDHNETVTAVLDDIVVTYGVEWAEAAPGPVDSTVVDIEIVSIDGKPWADVDGGYGGKADLLDTIVNRLEMDHEERMIEAATEVEADDGDR
jgi:hypothetical protein